MTQVKEKDSCVSFQVLENFRKCLLKIQTIFLVEGIQNQRMPYSVISN